MTKQGSLFVVATPIGNLGDLTERALKTLKAVDLIAAEDTRVAKKLLNHIGVDSKEIISYYNEVEVDRAPKILERIISQGIDVALISDAGTPCISDPGYRLIKMAREKGVSVFPVPGASSVLALLSASGLSNSRWMFVGFLPTKAKELSDELARWKLYGNMTVVFFDSTRRLANTLSEVKNHFPESLICIGRELTKLYEEFFYGKVSDSVAWVEAHDTLKGECVCAIELLEEKSEMISEEDLIKRAKVAFKKGASLKDLLVEYKSLGFSKNELYSLLLRAK